MLLLKDPHPTMPYLAHVLDMADSSMMHSPSSGVCIDRQDWIGVVNPGADDGQTWFPTGDPSNPFQRVRAMIFAWKLAIESFAAQWHAHGQVVIINDHSNRLDMMRYCDGIYAEMGDMQTPTYGLNKRMSEQVEGAINAHAVGTALASLGPRVAFIWNHPKPNVSSEYIAAGLAAHLWVRHGLPAAALFLMNMFMLQSFACIETYNLPDHSSIGHRLVSSRPHR